MKKPIKVIAAAAAVLTLGGALLGAAQGTQTDPLVTMSYVTNVATPKILKDVDTKLDGRESALVARLNTEIDRYAKDMEKLFAGVSDNKTDLTTSAFTAVTVENGKVLTGGVGTEILLRAGTAVCVASTAPGLSDTTGGATLASGGALVANHLYLAAGEGQGLKATSTCTVLVRGSYSIR